MEGIHHKLLLKLLEFDYRVEYKKGKENVATNAIFRKYSMSQEGEGNCYTIVVIVPEWVEDVKGSYVNNPQYEIMVVAGQMQGGVDNRHTLKSGLIKYKGRIYARIGNNSRSKILDLFHSSSLRGYSGTSNTYHRLKKLFYWSKLKRNMEMLVAEYPVC